VADVLPTGKLRPAGLKVEKNYSGFNDYSYRAGRNAVGDHLEGRRPGLTGYRYIEVRGRPPTNTVTHQSRQRYLKTVPVWRVYRIGIVRSAISKSVENRQECRSETAEYALRNLLPLTPTKSLSGTD
jgi:hypothetical protein